MLEAREGDLEIALKATVDKDRLTLDFTGTADQHEGNLNCPLAVTRSACYFAIRVLTDPDIPPSAGAYRPVEVIAPEGSLLNARSPAAVVGGNVETSSRVADVVLKAFGRALGQGTMNNVTLGTEDVVYYETIGGGQGACPDADGPSGVHVAMSNTLNTPIEALELEFPMRMVQYALRRGSGGAGAHAGGDGVIRELEALEPLELLADHRAPAPPAVRGRRWRARGGRPQPARRQGAAREGDRAARIRPATSHRDTRWRRPRPPSLSPRAPSLPRCLLLASANRYKSRRVRHPASCSTGGQVDGTGFTCTCRRSRNTPIPSVSGDSHTFGASFSALARVRL